MAALSGNQIAILTARVGAARVGAFRIGFVPRDTQGVNPGTSGGFYKHRRLYNTTTTYTLVKS